MSVNDEVIECNKPINGDSEFNMQHFIDFSQFVQFDLKFELDGNDTIVKAQLSMSDNNGTLHSATYLIATIKDRIFLYNKAEDVSLFIGSYMGVSHFFRGLISYFSISQDPPSNII